MKNKKKGKVIQMLSPENYIRQKARTLPLFECRVNNEWKETGLADIFIARKHTNGNITAGLYLVDLKCLGLKDANYWFNINENEYLDTLEHATQYMEMEKISYTLAHNIIFAGIEFADEYGFKPHKDFTSVVQFILEEDTEDIELLEIECGIGGKPAYVRGPLDDDAKAARVIAQLEKVAGPGNYNIIHNDEEWDEMDETDLERPPSDATFQFKVQLKNISKPPVWRRIVMPSSYTFYDFHVAIQIAFEWTDSHLFVFSPKGFGSSPAITESHGEYLDDWEENKLEANEVFLNEIFDTEKQKYTYIYDFGDTWEHTITLEKIVKGNAKFADCLDGKGKCPPEDCGGIWGYEQLKEILADKKHPEYKEHAEWLGLRKKDTWDPAEFDLKEIRQMMSDVFNELI